MNKSLLSLLFLITSFAASSQKVYFIYLQSEQEQPFYVKMNEKPYSSSATGYLIIPKLVDSTYSFSIGFPQDRWPEQKFSVAMKAKDHGYIVKNFGEKGWGLFDLQSLSIQMSSTEPVKSSSKTEKRDVSVFTEILAMAADDSTLRERPVVAKVDPVIPAVKLAEPEKKEETKPATDPDVTKQEDPKIIPKEPTGIRQGETPGTVIVNRQVPDTLAVKKEEAEEPLNIKTEIKEPPVEKPDPPKIESKELIVDKNEQKAAEPEYKRSVVTKRFGKTTAEGLGLTFIDEYANGVKDTIHILIPDPKPPVAQVRELPKEEKKFLEMATNADSAMVMPVREVVKETVPAPDEPKPAVKTNNCKEVAVEADFLKLRKKMAAVTDDDDMVDQARKYFKTKCFTTLQLKNLGALFLDDLGKYKFFDMAYIFVSDRENFASLQNELKNEYYINRFKAMLK